MRGWYLLLPILLLAAVRGLWAPDEPRYAEVAREAWEHDLLVMHLNGELYPDKPPLVYWLAGACGKAFGWHEFALRLPSLVATLLTAWIAARLARRLWGELEARWTPLFVLGTAMVLEIGGRLQLDPVLACLCLAAIERATDDRGTARERALALVTGGLCAGLAALAKGPVAWLHVGVGVIALRRFAGASSTGARPALRAWLGFAALAVLPVLLWAGLAAWVDHARSGDWTLFRALFLKQHVGRVIDGTQHKGPPWEHLANFPLYFLPFTPFFFAGLARAWRERRDPGHDRAVRAATVWFLVLFVVFSAMPPKRDLYLLPVYPAAALIAARLLARHERGEIGLARTWGIVSAALWMLIGLAGLAAFVGVGWLGAPSSPEDATDFDTVAAFATANRSGIVAVFLALLAGGSVALRAFARGRNVRGLDALGFSTCAALALAAVLVVPALDPLKSARLLAEELAARPEKPSAIPCVGVQPEGYRFYGRVPAVKGELEPALAREGRQFLALVTAKSWKTLTETQRARFRVLGGRSVGSRDVLMLGAADDRR